MRLDITGEDGSLKLRTYMSLLLHSNTDICDEVRQQMTFKIFFYLIN